MILFQALTQSTSSDVLRIFWRGRMLKKTLFMTLVKNKTDCVQETTTMGVLQEGREVELNFEYNKEKKIYSQGAGWGVGQWMENY